MHELSLCESVIALIEKKAVKEADAPLLRVVKITLAIGAQAGACPEALAFCFPFVAKGTLAEDATLAFENASGRDLRVVSFEVEKHRTTEKRRDQKHKVQSTELIKQGSCGSKTNAPSPVISRRPEGPTRKSTPVTS